MERRPKGFKQRISRKQYEIIEKLNIRTKKPRRERKYYVNRNEQKHRTSQRILKLKWN